MEPGYQDLESQSHDAPPQQSRRQSQGGGPSLTIDTSNAASRNGGSSNGSGNSGRPNTNFRRQKSLVRPERERIDKNHPQYFYRNVTQNLDGSHVKVQASSTGNDPTGGGGGAAPSLARGRSTSGGFGGGIRRGKSVLGREPEKPGQTRATKASSAPKRKTMADIKNMKNPLKKKEEKREWPSKWIIYYNAITCCFPAALLKSCGRDGIPWSGR